MSGTWAIILVLASSGLRVGELVLWICETSIWKAPQVQVTVRASKSKNKQGRFTFITPEAAEAVQSMAQEPRSISPRIIEAQQEPDHQQGLKTRAVQTDSTLLFPVSDSQNKSGMGDMP